MQLQQFAGWKQKILLGASLKVVAPTGQYDPTKLINWGIHRWAFRPELGYSERWGNWVLDGYAGVWFYTTNSAFYDIPFPKPQTEAPIGSLEGHLSYDFKKLGGLKKLRGWASLDGNFWWGGIAVLNGIPTPRQSKPAPESEGPSRCHLRSINRLRSLTALARTVASAGTTRTYKWRGSIPGLGALNRTSPKCFPKT
jgi:Putative MetA-pathway of phenol degradation